VAQAALGDKITVPTLDGEEEFAIPAGTQTGETFRLGGKGVPYLRRNGRGDQVIIVQVLTPTKLNEKQRELLAELGQTLGKEVVQQPEKGFFEKFKDALGI
jgi:molecular chaperone DnaJ